MRIKILIMLAVLALTVIPSSRNFSTGILPNVNEIVENPEDYWVNLDPTQEVIEDGELRGLGDILYTIYLDSIGMPGSSYNNAGLSWDGEYLYLVNMHDNNVYVIDPEIPTIINNFPLPPDLCWGIGSEENLWITETSYDTIYEYSHLGIPTANQFFGLHGGASWMGDGSEHWPIDDEIWLLAVGGTNKAYKFLIPGGTVIDSIGHPAWTYTSQRGLTYDPFNNTFWVGGWNSDSIWEIDGTTGAPLRSFYFGDIASLAYDWESTLHDRPVLWVATNASENRIYMVDVENPPPPIVWDFEDGWQGWRHTNGLSFPYAWDVQPSDIHASVPNAGDSTLWIDADAGGGSMAVSDTAWSPIFIPDSTETDWIRYGLQFNGGGTTYYNDLFMGIRTYSGGGWNAPVELKYYAQGTSFLGWDSVDVSSFNDYERMQIYYFFDDYDTWGYYAGVDNISVVGTIYGIEYDVGVISVDIPGDFISPGTTVNPAATFGNFGMYPESFDVYYQIDSSGVTIYNENMNLTLTNGTDSTVEFPSFTSCTGVGVVYDIIVYTVLTGDENSTNDILYSITTVNPWEIATNIPMALMDEAVVSKDDNIYVIGGYPVGDSIFIYSSSKGTWSRGTCLPIDLSMFDACVLGDTIYVPGGYAYSQGVIIDSLYKYSISGNNWTVAPGTGEPAWFYACEAADGKIYRIGGYNSATSTIWPSTWEYDPTTGSWTKKANMPTPTELAVRWEKNDTIYIAGGHDGSATPRQVTQFYDAKNDVWTQNAAHFAYLPNTLWGAGSAVLNDTVYVMGGVYGGSITDSVFYYDYGTNAWYSYPVLIQSVYRADGVGVEGVSQSFDGIYLFGGSISSFNAISMVQRSKISTTGINDFTEEDNENVLSLPCGIFRGNVRFTYTGKVNRDIVIYDLTGRVIKEYQNVKPGSLISCSDGEIPAGIYFINVKGLNVSAKITLLR